MGPGAVSSNCIPGGGHLFVDLDLALGGPDAAAAGRVGAGAAESVRGTGLARLRRGLGHRPYRLAHRTPVLYSRNQSRTNIVPCKEKREKGAGKLAELLIMVLKPTRGTWIVRGRYWSASRTTSPTGSWTLWSQSGSYSSSSANQPGGS
jgi:hypothetical protein